MIFRYQIMVLRLFFFFPLFNSSVLSAQELIPITHSCSYNGEESENEYFTFEPSLEAGRIVLEICQAMGLEKNFIVRSSDVTNALAAVVDGKRVILYNTVFMENFKDDAQTRWAAYSVLAHEIGHHLNGHNFDEDDTSKRKMMELQADKFSGSVLRLLGSTFDEAKAGVELFVLNGGSESKTKNHPPFRARVEAVASGWKLQDERLKDLNASVGTAPSGIVDTDGDGVIDRNDKCPNEKGLIEYGGCPVPGNFRAGKFGNKIDSVQIRKTLEESADIVIDYSGIGIPPTIRAKPPLNFHDDYDTYYSFNGVDYVLLEGYTQVEKTMYDSLFLKFITKDNKIQAGPIFKKNAFLDATKTILKELSKKSSSRNVIECDPSGCTLNLNFFLNSFAEKLKIVNLRSGFEREFQLDKMRMENYKFNQLCLTPAVNLFKIEPFDKLEYILIYNDKSEIKFKTEVEEGPYHPSTLKTNTSWIELEKFDSNDEREYPYLLVNAEGYSVGPFSCFIGMGKCSSYEDTTSPKVILIDVDGKGFVEADKVYYPFEFKPPASGKIGIIIDLFSGKRLGPFYYKFDVDKVLSSAALKCDEPRLSVDFDSQLKKKVGRFKNRLLCLRKVVGIKFGTTGEKLDSFIPFKVTDKAIINLWNARPDDYQYFPELTLPSVEIPDGVSDLYYKIVFTDRESNLLRLQIN